MKQLQVYLFLENIINIVHVFSEQGHWELYYT